MTESRSVWRSKYLFALVAGSIIGAVMVIPYGNALIGRRFSTGGLIFAYVLQTFLNYGLFGLGLAAAQKVGIARPVLKGWDERREDRTELRNSIRLAVILAIASVAAIYAIGSIGPSLDLKPTVTLPSAGIATMASIGAGVSEEIMLRLFVMSIVAFLLLKVIPSRNASIRIAIVTASLLFGAMHLPLASSIGTLTFASGAVVVLANAAAGTAFGWLYWKRGLVAAMISHTFLDLIIKVLLPAIFILLHIDPMKK